MTLRELAWVIYVIIWTTSINLVCLDNITIELMFLGINMFVAQLMSYEEGQKHICFQEHQLYYTIITIIKA